MIAFTQTGLIKQRLIEGYQRFGLNSYWAGNEYDLSEVYYILFNGTIIGFLNLKFYKYRNGRKYGYIEMIELLPQYRGSGLGEKVVVEIFKYFKVNTITGEALSSAIPFWRNLGADFFVSDEDLSEYIENGYSSAFELKYVNVCKNIKKIQCCVYRCISSDKNFTYLSIEVVSDGRNNYWLEMLEIRYSVLDLIKMIEGYYC